MNIKIDSQLFESLTRACQGLSLERIRRVFQKLLQLIKQLMKIVLLFYLSEKKQIISQTEILEYYIGEMKKLLILGGLDNLKDWLKKTKNSF